MYTMDRPKCIVSYQVENWASEYKGFTLTVPIMTAADNKWDIFPNFWKKNKVKFHENCLRQTILMKYHALSVIFEKAAKFKFVVCCKL